MNSLISEQITLPAVYSLTPSAVAARDEMLKACEAVAQVTNAEEQNQAVALGSQLQSHIKEVTEMGLELRRPLNEAAKELKQVQDDYLRPLLLKKIGLGELVTGFQEAEAKRVKEEERKRREEVERLSRIEQEAQAKSLSAKTEAGQLKAELAAHHAGEAALEVLRAPLPTAVKAQKSATKRRVKHKVLDARKVYAVRPDLCSIEVKTGAVNSICTPKEGATELNPDTETVPGLALFFENSTEFRA